MTPIDPPPRCSIVIPVYKECENINACFTHLRKLRGIEDSEIMHVNTILTKAGLDLVARTLESYDAGAFSLGVIGASPLLNTWLAYLNGRKRLSFTPYGDQSIFMTRDTFRCVGGVPPIPIMEDLESFLSSGLTSPCLAETLKRYLIESEV